MYYIFKKQTTISRVFLEGKRVPFEKMTATTV